MLNWNDYNTILQLWSGTIGAIVGAIFGAMTAITVLLFSNGAQKKLARAALKQQARDAKKALAAQRDEARERRELEAIAGILQVVAGVRNQPLETYSVTVEQLVHRCNLHLLNSPRAVVSAWSPKTTSDRTGVTSHPIGQTIAIAVALAQLREPVLRGLRGTGTPEATARLRSYFPEQIIDERFMMIGNVLVDWPHLNDDEKILKAARYQELSRRNALEYCKRLSEVVNGPGTTSDVKYWTVLRQLAGKDLLLQANIVVQAAHAEERRQRVPTPDKDPGNRSSALVVL